MRVPVRGAAPTAPAPAAAPASATALFLVLVLALVLGPALSACDAPRTTDGGGTPTRGPAADRHPTVTIPTPIPIPTAASAALRAERVSPTDIDLRWHGGAPGTSGHVLEFATDESGPYTVLQYLPPQVTRYRHPDLMPHTTFHYRLRDVRGPASEAVGVTLPAGGLTAVDENSGHDWLPARKDPERTVPGRPLRHRAAEPGAPTGFKAVVKHANGILFTWTDHASDEEGFLLESRVRGDSGYAPVAVLGPDVNSAGLITLPTEKRASYRVRAFTHGALSNVVRLTTGASDDQ